MVPFDVTVIGSLIGRLPNAPAMLRTSRFFKIQIPFSRVWPVASITTHQPTLVQSAFVLQVHLIDLFIHFIIT